jgi:glucosamine--fructose-6-phosphate aminotransferase (isomerizing)
MCHLVGYIHTQSVVSQLIESLRLVEAIIGAQATGLAVIQNDKIKMKKDVGPVQSFLDNNSLNDFNSYIGIGHTRYTPKNLRSKETNTPAKAHPFWNTKKTFVTMHNGTIFNAEIFVKELEEKGYSFRSKSTITNVGEGRPKIDFTDSEIFSYLLEEELGKKNDMEEGIRNACENLRGNYAFVVLHQDYPDTLFIANWMQPLVVASNEEGAFFSSFEEGFQPVRNLISCSFHPPFNSLIVLKKGEAKVKPLLKSLKPPTYLPDSDKMEHFVLTAIKMGHLSLGEIYLYLINNPEVLDMTKNE